MSAKDAQSMHCDGTKMALVISSMSAAETASASSRWREGLDLVVHSFKLDEEGLLEYSRKNAIIIAPQLID